MGLGKTRAASVNELLAKKPTLRALAAARPPQADWRQWLAARLPEELSPHLHDVLLKAGELVVYAENASWCSRLRYAMAALTAAIATRDAQVQRVTVRVMPRGVGTPAGRRGR